MKQPEKSIERTLTIAAPRPRVFRALMDPGALSRWLFATVTLTPKEGSSYSFEWRDSAMPAIAQGEIRELVPDRKLVLSWFMQEDGATSTASFELEDGPEGATTLRFAHGGLPPEPEWEPRFRRVALEWDKVLLNLRFLLEEEGEGKHLFFFRAETRIPAALHRVFASWLTPGGLNAWMARDAFVIAEDGRGLDGVTLDTGRPLEIRYHRIDPDRHLRMSWSEGGKRGLIGVSFWSGPEGTGISLTLRSFALLEGERPIVQALWERRFQRISEYLSRKPLEAGGPEALGSGAQPVAGALSGSSPITVLRSYEATAGRVWNALTDASILRLWFASWTDFDPRAGAGFVLLWDGFGEVMGRVEEVRPGWSVRFSWDLAEPGKSTEVTVRVQAQPGHPESCRCEIIHAGWGDGEIWERQKSAHLRGW